MNRRDFTRAAEYADRAAVLAQGASSLAPERERAIAALREHGFPGRDEAWKYTRASQLLRDDYAPADGPPLVALPQGPWGEEPRIVFVDGVWAPALSTLEAPTLDRVEAGELEGFSALNLAFLRGGVSLTLREPRIHLLHVSTGAGRLGAARHRVACPSGQAAELVEHFLTVGEGRALTTAAVSVVVEEGGTVHHVRVLDEGAEVLHHGVVSAEVHAQGTYDLTSVVLGARVARIEATVRLVGKEASTALRGLSLLRGEQHADHHITVDHVVPAATSDQVFRAVLDDRSRSVYTGAVIVREGAVGTDSNQLHHALLLSDDAVANTRPWLQIDNDDVTCAHGAAIGSLDPDALFYLRQRGLSEVEARALLTWGFATSTLGSMQPGPVQDALQEQARAWLGGRA